MFKIVTIPLLTLLITLSGCGGSGGSASTPETPPSTPLILMPTVTNADNLTPNVQKFGRIELDISLSAEFDNPFDLRQINLMATFSGPNGEQMAIPGFWDARSRWLIRFSPPAAGAWEYNITAEDSRGISTPYTGNITVADSNNRGWLLPGDQVNPNYSKHYLAYHDGTPFYGFGHADAFAISFDTRIEPELNKLISEMREANENYIVYWSYFYFSPVEDDFQTYTPINLEVMDTFVERLRIENLHMVYTLWDHNQLRGDEHPWGSGSWFSSNGFNRLTSVINFFTDEEAWEWQKNLYRYSIARWGYSSSIAMWQTVSEINGTNAQDNTNVWHERVNQYFIDNDPYRHPTTASMSGDVTWDRGHAAMDVPQVHIYADLLAPFTNDQGLIIETAEVIAGYTSDMWHLEEKPNWIGEFGVLNRNTNSSDYPELFHNALWAGLANGAAMTPAEWNDFFNWGVMTDAMKAHMRHLVAFMADVPLVAWNPNPIEINSEGQQFKAWGLTSSSGTIIWGLDTTHKGRNIDEIRARRTEQTDINILIMGLEQTEYQVTPFNTWTGQPLESYTFFCSTPQQGCDLTLPPFTSDIALKLTPLAQ